MQPPASTAADIWQVAAAIVVSLGGGGAIVVGFSSWLGKLWSERIIQGDIARYRSELERLKGELQRLGKEHEVRFSRIDAKQAEVISTIFSHLYDLQRGILGLGAALRGREIREDFDRQYLRDSRPEYSAALGIDTLTDNEQRTVDELLKASRELGQYYGRNRLYVPVECLELLDRVQPLAYFVADSFHSVAVKDRDGHLYVNPRVKEVWDSAMDVSPSLLAQLEAAFRKRIGIESAPS